MNGELGISATSSSTPIHRLKKEGKLVNGVVLEGDDEVANLSCEGVFTLLFFFFSFLDFLTISIFDTMK